MSGTTPTTRSQAVSDSYIPTLTQGRRVRSLGAALAGGSPQSSPSPPSDGSAAGSSRLRLQELSDQLGFLDGQLNVFPLQRTSSQGGPLPSTSAGASGSRARSLPIGGALEEVLGSEPDAPSVNDVPMESATERELRQTLRDIRACLPLSMSKVEKAVDEAKAKIDAATTDGGLAAALPTQFQSDTREFLRGYRAQVEVLASARSYATKLRKHKKDKTFPASINSIKSPSIQFSHAFVNAPADDNARGSYNLALGAGNSVFETAVDRAVKHLREEILEKWIAEKAKEVRFLEGKASVPSAVTAFEGVVTKKHGELKA